MEQWKEIKLADICEIKYGKDHKKLDDGNIPVYGSGGIIRYVDTYIYDNKSVLIPRKGTLKNLFFVDGKFWTVDTIFWTKFKNSNVFEKYIYYFLQTQNLESYNVGTAVPSLTTSILNELKVNLPPLEEQKSIANTLSCLDEKIELNNKINKNLEEMAQAIFKKWFIDFDYPLTDEEIANGGREFVDSELGKIPKGWKVVKINEISQITYGKNLPKKNLKSKGYPVYGGNGIIGHYNEFLYKTSKILISCRGENSGNINFSLPYSYVTNNSLVINLLNEDYSYFYKYYFLFNDFKKHKTGSAQPQITIDNIKNVKVLFPNNTITNNFKNFYSSIFEIYLNTNKENEKLTQIRDTLLPKLINGDVRVPY